MRQSFFDELGAVLSRGFNGKIVLHCDRGRVMKYEVNETRKPKTTDRERVDLQEPRVQYGWEKG